MKYCRSSQSRRTPEEEKWERHLIQGQANMRNPFPEFTTEELWSTSIHKSKEIVELISNYDSFTYNQMHPFILQQNMSGA